MAGESVADYCLSYVSRRTKKFTRATKRNNGRGVVLVVFHTRGVHSRVDPHDVPDLKDAHFMFLDSLLQSGSEELVHAAQNYNIGTQFVVWVVCESTMTQEPYVSRVYTLPTSERDGPPNHSPSHDAPQQQQPQQQHSPTTVVVAPMIPAGGAYMVQGYGQGAPVQAIGYPVQIQNQQGQGQPAQQSQQAQQQKPPATLPLQDVSDFSASWRSRMLDLLQGTSTKAEAEAIQLQPAAVLHLPQQPGPAAQGYAPMAQMMQAIPQVAPMAQPTLQPMNGPMGMHYASGMMMGPGQATPSPVFQPMYQAPGSYAPIPMGAQGPLMPPGAAAWDVDGGRRRAPEQASKEFWDAPYTDRGRSANRLLEFEEEVDPVESWSAIAAHFRSGAKREKGDAQGAPVGGDLGKRRDEFQAEKGGIGQLRTEASALRNSLNTLVSRFDDINQRSPERPKSIEEIMNSLDSKLKQTDASLFDGASPVKSGHTTSQSPQRDLIHNDNATARARRLEGESLRNELQGQMEALKSSLVDSMSRAESVTRSPQQPPQQSSRLSGDFGQPSRRLSSDPSQPTTQQLQHELEELKQTMNRRVEEEVERRVRLLRREWEVWVQTLGQRMEQKMEQMIRMNA